MQGGGLSAAMGAFLAGVLLSESTFRHQLEADIEPFRGLLLGLFFLAVGATLDLGVVASEWRLVLGVTLASIGLKGVAVYAAARAFGAGHGEALARAATMAHGGEFAFVLYAAALAVGLIDARLSAVLTAAVVVSMILMPLLVAAEGRLAARRPRDDGPDEEGPRDLGSHALLIGFGRVGQIASQVLLGRGHSVSIIDTDNEMIRVAGYMGFKVFFGDGSRLDILQAAGAAGARVILVCIDRPEAATRIVEIARAEFPEVPVLARAFDRAHALALIRAGVDWQIRETFESALALGREALERLGEGENSIADAIEEVRRRDADRLAAQMAGDISSGRDLLLSNLPDELRDRLRAQAPPAWSGPEPVEGSG